MRVFVAGASGAIGKRLVPLLVAGGHQVTASTRTANKLAALRALGADAVVADGLDRESVARVVAEARPEVIVHQMTALASLRSLKNFDAEFAQTNRLRTEGTGHLLAAARIAGVRTFVAQSYAGWPSGQGPDRVATEDDPLDSHPLRTMEKGLAAIRSLESQVASAPGIAGIVLRYGGFYGPGTSLAADGEVAKMVRERKFPVVGGGSGVWSFIHVDDAARATVAAIERGAPGIYQIADDQPAKVREWLPGLAEIIGAPRPRNFPAWLARFAIGEAGVFLMTAAGGASNAKARRALGWAPMYPSWREGFSRGLSGEPSVVLLPTGETNRPGAGNRETSPY